MARHRGKVMSRQAKDSGVLVTSSDYYVNVEGDADKELTILNAADESLEHNVLKTMFRELQEAYHRGKVFLLSCMIDVVDFVLGRGSALVAG